MSDKAAVMPVSQRCETGTQPFDAESFRKLVEAQVAHPDFTIVASNCLGGEIYRRLNLPCNTPFVGLGFHAPCYIRLLENLERNLYKEIRFTSKSKYRRTNVWRILNNSYYPIGLLDDIEIHFRHFRSPEECLQKWTTRRERMNFDNLFFLFTDRDECTEREIAAFDSLPFPRKVCFTARAYPQYDSCVHIKAYEHEPHVGDLNADFGLLTQHFDFAAWFSSGSGKA